MCASAGAYPNEAREMVFCSFAAFQPFFFRTKQETWQGVWFVGWLVGEIMMMMAPDVLNEKGTMGWSHYCIKLDNETNDWVIERDGVVLMVCDGRSYVQVKVLLCGICSTDTSLHRFPFTFPVVGGHELVVELNGVRYCVDINASCAMCLQCGTAPSQCPTRRTVGIDRLLGGFAPFILVPRHCLYAVKHDIPDRLAVVAEPFAAALHVLSVAEIPLEANICVLGPKKLGFLIVLALQARGYTAVSVLGRCARALELCQELGAVEVQDEDGGGAGRFDWVFDCTGTPSGFQRDVQLARPGGTIHVKSTGGHAVGVVTRMTQLVVDEIAILPRAVSSFHWARSKQGAHSVVDVAHFADIDSVHLSGKLRARDAIRVTDANDSVDGGLWFSVWEKQLSIHTSRCGDIQEALNVLGSLNAKFVSIVTQLWISHVFSSRTMIKDKQGCMIDDFPFCFLPTTVDTSQVLKAIISHI